MPSCRNFGASSQEACHLRYILVWETHQSVSTMDARNYKTNSPFLIFTFFFPLLLYFVLMTKIKESTYSNQRNEGTHPNKTIHNQSFLLESLTKYRPNPSVIAIVTEATTEVYSIPLTLPKTVAIRTAVATYFTISINHLPNSFFILQR